MRKKRTRIFLLCLPAVLVIALGIRAFITMRTEPGAVYTGRAAFAERDGGAHIGVNPFASLFLTANGIGSDAGTHEDGGVTFYPTVDEEGLYCLNISFISGSGDRYFDLDINGKVTKVPCPGERWIRPTMKSVQIWLQAGRNTLRFGCKDWYAPNLNKISIEKSALDLPPNPVSAAPDTVQYKDGDMTLTLDRANGTYSVTQNGRVLLKDAFCAATADGERVWAQDYTTHTAAKSGKTITFVHKKAGAVTLEQEFTFGEGYLLTKVTAYGTQSNRIAPVYTISSESLSGGDLFLQVPFDNDGFASFDTAAAEGVGTSHEITALLNSENGSAVVLGSVTHDTWKTGIDWVGAQDSLLSFCVYGGAADYLTRDTQPHGTITGDVVSPTILIGAFADWREGLDTYGKVNAELAPPLPFSGNAPIGWSSWGAVQFKLTKETAYAVSDYWKAELQPTWQGEDDTVYINLDSGWNDILPGDELEKFVDHCAKNGQTAGIYYTPFAAWSNEAELKKSGSALYDALLRDADGKVLPSWDGALALDPTHPAVIERINTDLQRYIDAGVGYIKLDFISHGAMEGAHYDKSVRTGIQAYNKGMKQIADKVGGKMFINLSIAPIFPHQYAHGRRLACDTFYGIGETQYMLNSLSFGFWESRIYACPDPDHIVVWGNDGGFAELNEARARVTSGVIAASFLAGDAFSDPPGNSADAKARFGLLLKNPEIMALAKSRTVFRPAAEIPGRTANVYTAQIDGKTYIAVFNFDGEAKDFTLAIPNGTTQLRELWSGEALPVDGTEAVSVSLSEHDAKVFVLIDN
ncbi:MAG: hypothetical protein LBT21_07780 [Oscillospiraceae bacterium]|nr:hypothetical protein [Oscillospiraceae bacterium]